MLHHTAVMESNIVFVENALKERLLASLRRASDNADTGANLSLVVEVPLSWIVCPKESKTQFQSSLLTSKADS